MKRIGYLFIAFTLIIFVLAGNSQTFDINSYKQFLSNHQNMSSTELMNAFQPEHPFYSGFESDPELDKIAYLDSVIETFKLTQAELDLLTQNRFMVTERLNFTNFDQAFHKIYEKDLPVFLTTDAVLYALHYSYDKILKDVEISIIHPKLEKVLTALYETLPELYNHYQTTTSLHTPLADVDVYVTIARSLFMETELPPQFAHTGGIKALLQAIGNEKMVQMPLFSDRNRRLDFSQFTVRGHYTDTFFDIHGNRQTLGPYFKTMMWLGRMDFMLTPPPENPWEEPWSREAIRRMNLGAILLNELIDMADVRPLLQEIDQLLTFMVNESDNLTPQELDDTITRLDIKAPDLLDDNRYDHYQTVLKSNVNAGQKILSSILLMDPYDPKPGELPLSFRLMGQRFVIDSYVFSNVVFDRIVFNKEKIWRGLPDPLDAMFVLGNDAALPLLEQELETYHYGSQLNALRYLVDSYTDEFWNQSLYNVWLNAIRSFNSVKERMDFPLFMQTTAWQQQKLNTQLSSWTQLRHDNLLYAKQSYTGGTACSYPHSYIEPYPDFYRNLAAFAHKASTFFADYSGNEMLLNRIIDFFKTMEPLMYKLERLATKELNHQPFTQEETDWLKKMLFHEAGSGVPPFSGWYADLYYRLGEYIQANYDGSDYLVADVHTQPTNRAGAPVGRILHVGVGKINLGVFVANAPSGNWQQTAYVGPVMSYYEKITENFDRLTDERWAELVNKGEIPKRPDWINSYLADARGNARPTGREIPGVLMTGIDKNTNQPKQFKLLQNHPNPFNPSTVITYTLPYETHVNLVVYDILGRQVATLVDDRRNKGEHSIEWQAHEFPSGVYLVRLITDYSQKTIKMMLVK